MLAFLACYKTGGFIRISVLVCFDDTNDFKGIFFSFSSQMMEIGILWNGKGLLKNLHGRG